LDDDEIVLDPTRISWAGNGFGGDVVKEVAPTEVNVKETTPMIVTVRGEI
jgi:hypothetical protein